MPGNNRSYFGVLKSIDFRPTPQDWEKLYHKRGETIAERDKTIIGLRAENTKLKNEIIKLKRHSDSVIINKNK